LFFFFSKQRFLLFSFLNEDFCFGFVQVQSEIRLPKTQGIAGHVATTGKM
jgi:hypothetical protein